MWRRCELRPKVQQSCVNKLTHSNALCFCVVCVAIRVTCQVTTLFGTHMQWLKLAALSTVIQKETARCTKRDTSKRLVNNLCYDYVQQGRAAIAMTPTSTYLHHSHIQTHRMPLVLLQFNFNSFSLVPIHCYGKQIQYKTSISKLKLYDFKDI